MIAKLKAGETVRIPRKEYTRILQYLRSEGLTLMPMTTTKDYVEIKLATKQ